MSDSTDLCAAVEGHDGIFVVRAGKTCHDWNGIHYQVGLSAKNVGSKSLSMNVATIPPGNLTEPRGYTPANQWNPTSELMPPVPLPMPAIESTTRIDFRNLRFL